MFNARRSALYIAIIGLGFAAGEASAACPTGYKAVSTYTAGYKVTTCVRTGSEVVDVTVQPDGGEGAPLSNPSVQASVTGAYIDGGEGPPCEEEECPSLGSFAPSSFMHASFKKAKKPKPPKEPKCYIFVPKDGDDDGDDAHDKVKKVKVPCTAPVPFNPPFDELTDSNGDLVNTLSSPTKKMKCTGAGESQECTQIVTILPTDANGASLICPNGGTAINFTANPPFVITVNINGGDILSYFGCYGLAGTTAPGNYYTCEPLYNWDGECGTAYDDSGDTYCTTGKLPSGDLTCTEGGGSA